MDGLFPFLSEKCSTEQLIKDFHALVHADDTLIISTDRDKFITKCNHMLEYFAENSLVLNFDKSSYFIINPKKTDRKVRLQLSQGYLKYKSIQEYLGVIITDGGVLKHDVSKFIRDKRSNILIKFINFVNKNFLAPLGVKLAVIIIIIIIHIYSAIFSTPIVFPYKCALSFACNLYMTSHHTPHNKNNSRVFRHKSLIREDKWIWKKIHQIIQRTKQPIGR